MYIFYKIAKKKKELYKLITTDVCEMGTFNRKIKPYLFFC